MNEFILVLTIIINYGLTTGAAVSTESIAMSSKKSCEDAKLLITNNITSNDSVKNINKRDRSNYLLVSSICVKR